MPGALHRLVAGILIVGLVAAGRAGDGRGAVEAAGAVADIPLELSIAENL
jgi:hypothetical protein